LTQIDVKPVTTLEAVAIRFNQYGRELFQFSLPAGMVRDLIASEKMDIDRYHPDKNPEGYQRVPTETRYKKFGKFVVKTRGISPTSILVSLRDKRRLEAEEIGEGNAVRLRIDLKGAKLYIPDGQHRAYGLRWAVDQYPGQVEDYEVPIVLFVADGDDPRFEEALQFYTINNNAKRVRTDLAQQHVLRAKEKELGGPMVEDAKIPPDATLRELEPYAVKIAFLCNASGPLRGKIAPPNVEMPAASVSQSSFVDSIKPLLQVASEMRWNVKDTKGILDAFWTAVKKKCPAAFEHWSNDSCDIASADHFDAVLATTTGVYSLNDLLTRTLRLSEVSKDPASPATFERLLDRPELEDFFGDGPEGYWGSKSPMEGSASSHGTSRKSFKEISGDMWDELRGA
jgi:DGQHR domain-containing protein